WRAEQRARAAQRNGLRALVGRAAREPDLSDPPGGPSLYCRALTRIAAWLGPQELQAQEPRRQAQDSARGRADGRFERTLGPSLVSRALPRTQLSEVKLLWERERSARIREAVYLVEFHKKYAVPAACIVFVLIGVPVALRFPRGGVGLVV
ncbi:MAG: LptF/LptG family permease, partial [Gammaproteobacteria bacterium]|nr:LptF/LptG family permease [Gammaproteobacteria bacterium]NIV73288.1 LptF/LptG family permease [Gammaproteobacteria bacterium]